jgi:ABC-2 type transport system permease protein
MKLLFKYLATHLKVSLEYKVSLLLSLIAQGLVMLAELFAINSLFHKFGLLDSYNIYELLFGFSIVWLGFSLSEMFFRGFDHFSDLIVHGKFDLLLIRPRNIYLQILGNDICYEKTSRVLVSLSLFIYSSTKIIETLTFTKLLTLILIVFGAVTIFASIFIIGAAFCFITIQGLEVVNIFTDGSRQLTQYPMGIYKKIVRIVFTFIIPLMLVNYYPVQYLTGKSDNIIYVFFPLLSILFFIISILIFNQGIKKYNSTGS